MPRIDASDPGQNIEAERCPWRIAVTHRGSPPHHPESFAVSADIVKGYLMGIMKDLQGQGMLHSVIELIDWNVTFQGNVMHVVMEPKKGLDDVDYSRAVNFLFNLRCG